MNKELIRELWRNKEGEEIVIQGGIPPSEHMVFEAYFNIVRIRIDLEKNGYIKVIDENNTHKNN